MSRRSTRSGGVFIDLGFTEVIVPTIWELGTFTDKLGLEKEAQMWSFRDRGGRSCCLLPEVTGVIQEMWRGSWSKTERRPMRIFYIQRCYRYERPQAGRYREFTQAGIEILGGSAPADRDEAVAALRAVLAGFPVEVEFVGAVKRGLAYYVEDGFEVECQALGAQKQVAGGGRYAEGIGWAIGIERLMLASQIMEGCRSGLSEPP